MKNIRLFILAGITIFTISSLSTVNTYAKPKETEVAALDLDQVVQEGHENLELDEPEIEEAIDTSVSHGTPLDIEKAKEEALKAAKEEADKKAAEQAKKEAEEKAKKEAEAKQAEEANKKEEPVASKENNENTDSGKGPGVTGPVASKSVSVQSNNFDRKKLVEYALSFVGHKYVYGGTTPDGFDCSGFTQYVYKHAASKSLLRNSASQSTQGRSVSFDEIQIGDLLFYSSGSRINHVGIYIGNGKIVHASNPSSGVKISPWDYRNPVVIKNVLD